MSQEETAALLESLHFPDAMEVAAQQAQEFRQLAPEDRWREILGLMQFGLNMVRSSPNREAIERRWLAQEEAWQEIQRQLFIQHGE